MEGKMNDVPIPAVAIYTGAGQMSTAQNDSNHLHSVL